MGPASAPGRTDRRSGPLDPWELTSLGGRVHGPGHPYNRWLRRAGPTLRSPWLLQSVPAAASLPLSLGLRLVFAPTPVQVQPSASNDQRAGVAPFCNVFA